MAQNFRNQITRNTGTSAVDILAQADSYDTVIGISVANVTASSIAVDVFINDGANDIYLVKGAPIPSGSALQVIDGGARFVMQNSDVLKVQSDTASSADVWVSAVDDIST